MRKIAKETREAVIEDLKAGGYSKLEIARRHGVSDVYVGSVAKQVACRCPKCNSVPPIGSRFCNMCGTRILTEKELVVEKLKKAAGLCAGSMNADEIRDAIFMAVKMLEGK